MRDVSSLALDIGSTTVKAVVLEGSALRFSAYQRHNADARGALRGLLGEIADRFPGQEFQCAVTGSAGLSAVSYTHLDVYKRQDPSRSGSPAIAT